MRSIQYMRIIEKVSRNSASLPIIIAHEQPPKKKKRFGSGGIRTHAIEMTGALNQRLRPLGHATNYLWTLTSEFILLSIGGAQRQNVRNLQASLLLLSTGICKCMYTIANSTNCEKESLPVEFRILLLYR